MPSEIWSANLSGWPLPTDSLVNKNLPLVTGRSWRNCRKLWLLPVDETAKLLAGGDAGRRGNYKEARGCFTTAARTTNWWKGPNNAGILAKMAGCWQCVYERGGCRPVGIGERS